MSKSNFFATTSEAREWLRQFPENDRALVEEWLNKLTFIDADTFRTKMLSLIKGKANLLSPDNPIALYVERELKKRNGKPQYAFHEKKSRIPPKRHSYGAAAKIKVIQAQRTVGPEYGSESLIAQLLTQLQRDNRKYNLNAGPDTIRLKDNQIKYGFIVCDFIGTGNRIRDFLDSFWQMATVKSWASMKLFKFCVLAYSGTRNGIANVRAHPSAPEVSWIAPCPDLSTEFPELKEKILREIFVRNDPIDHDQIESLGYRGQGAMLIFSHGCPNNAPRVLYKKRKNKWAPLFRERSNVIEELPVHSSYARRQSKFTRLTSPSAAKRLSSAALHANGLDNLLVLTALKAGYRFNEDISHATGLEIPDVEQAIEVLKSIGWISNSDRLTSEGHRNLALAEPLKVRRKHEKAVFFDKRVYYPKSLRPPV